MKTTVKQLATVAFLALLLIVVNVKAEGTEIKGAGSESIETTLQFEKWMTDETIWNPNSAMFAEFFQETEPKLELEDWMINDLIWNTANMSNDPRLMIEPWMLNESYWK